MSTRHHFVIVPLLLGAALGSLYAEGASFGDYLERPDYGLSLFMLSADEAATQTSDASTQSLTSMAVGIDWNFPIALVADNMAIGISPGLLGVVGSQNVSSFNTTSSFDNEGSYSLLMLGTPVFATLKYGTDAVFRNRSKFGATVGVGYQYNVFPGGGDSFGDPIFMAEANYRAGWIFKLRFVSQFASHDVSSNTTVSMKYVGLYVTPGR